MSQAMKINENSPAVSTLSAAEFTDLIMKSHVAVDAIKKENEDSSNPFIKTRRGKKNELMPTNGKVIELKEFANQKTAANAPSPASPATTNTPQQGDDPVNGTSIYFRLAALYVNDLMQVNQEEMSAQAVALQANEKQMKWVQDGYNKLQEDTDVKAKQNADKAKHFLAGMLFGGAGGVVLGLLVIGIAVMLAPLTAGASLAVGIAALMLIAGGTAIAVTGGVAYKDDQSNPGSVPMLSTMIDDSPEDPAKLAKNQAMTSLLNSLSSVANNDTSRNTQSLQNVNSLQQQYASMFSQMMNYYSNSMSAR